MADVVLLFMHRVRLPGCAQWRPDSRRGRRSFLCLDDFVRSGRSTRKNMRLNILFWSAFHAKALLG